MKLPATRALLAGASLLLAPMAARAQESTSPMAALNAQMEAVSRADSLGQVIQYLPPKARARAAGMTPEQQAAGLAEWQGDVAEYHAVRDEVAGDRGVVLVETDHGARVLGMSREDGRWRVEQESPLSTVTPGARGSFTATGAVEYDLAEAVVDQRTNDGVPVLVLGDALQALLTKKDVSRVRLALPECVEPGDYPLAPRPTEGGAEVGSRYWRAPHDDVEGTEYASDVSGALHVESVEDGRFSGTFEMRAADADGEVVTVTGRIENAEAPCDEGGQD